MSDTYGDGWSGTVLHVGGLTFTLPADSYYYGTAVACLEPGTTYTPYACGGTYLNEVVWSVGGVSGGAHDSCGVDEGSFTATLAPTPAPTTTQGPSSPPTLAPTLVPTATHAPFSLPTFPPTSVPFAPTAVTMGAQAQAAIDDGAPLVALAGDLLLDATISIVGPLVVELNGLGFALDGQGNVGCMYVSGPATVTLVDITLRDGMAANGGGLYAGFGASLFLSGVFVVDNVAELGGGLFLEFSSSVNLVNSTVASNRAADSGGGLLLGSSSSAIFVNSTVASNSAIATGGGLKLQTSSVNLESTTVASNKAAYGGGLFLIFSPSAIFANSTVASNSVDIDGGGLFLYSSSATLDNTTVASNRAADSGGGFYLRSSSSANLTNSLVTLNEINTDGGGIFLGSDSRAFLQLTTVSHNLADNGGGVYAAGGTLASNLSMVLSNSARFAGGGLYLLAGVSAKSTDSTFEGNSAGVMAPFELLQFEGDVGSCVIDGSCFYSPGFPSDYGPDKRCEFKVVSKTVLDVISFNTLQQMDILSIDGVEYSGTNGPDGVTVQVNSTIVFTSFDGGRDRKGGGFSICGRGTGGGIYADGATVDVVRSVVTRNSAGTHGGGIYLDNKVTLFGMSSDIDLNAAEISGGGIFMDSATISLVDVSLLNNSLDSASLSAQGGTAAYLECGSFQATDLDTSGDVGGPFASGGVTCGTSCPAGKHANCEAVEGTRQCFANCGKCQDCQAGRYSPTDGGTSAEACLPCASGLAASQEGSISCEPCSVGRFAANGTSDLGGGLLVQTHSGSPVCNPCPAGYITDAEAAFVCRQCPDIEFSTEGSSSCDACVKGYFRNDLSSSCQECPDGTKCDADGAATLERLPIRPGFWRIHQSSTLVHACIFELACNGSSVFADRGDSYCSSGHAGPLCAVCDANYYFSPDAKACLECQGSSDLIKASPTLIVLIVVGIISSAILLFYLFKHRLSLAAAVEEAKARAEEAKARAENEKRRLMDKIMKNDKVRALSKSLEADSGSVKRNDDGSFEFLKEVTHEVPPTADSSTSEFTVGLAMITTSITKTTQAAPATTVTVVRIQSLGSFSFFESTTWQDFRRALKPLTSYAQIATSISVNCDISFPSIFTSFLRYFNALNFDIFPYLGLQCQDFDYIDMMTATTLLPLVVAACLFTAYWMAQYNERRSGVSAGPTKDRIIFVFLAFSFLILSSVSSPLFNFFRCQSFEEVRPVQRYLIKDYSISCTTSRYEAATALALFGIAVYPIGIPAMFGCLLWQHRSVLGDVEAFKAEAAQDFPKTRHLKFLFERYSPNFFMFEVVDCVRRLLLASLIGIAPPESAVSPSLGVMFSIAFAYVYVSLRPYKNKRDNELEITLTYSLLLMFFEALLLKVDASADSESSLQLFGTLLTFIFLLGPALVFARLMWTFVGSNVPPASWSEEPKQGAEQGSVEIEMASLVASQQGAQIAPTMYVPPRMGVAASTKSSNGASESPLLPILDAAAAADDDDGIAEHIDATGRTYFHNKKSCKTGLSRQEVALADSTAAADSAAAADAGKISRDDQERRRSEHLRRNFGQFRSSAVSKMV